MYYTQSDWLNMKAATSLAEKEARCKQKSAGLIRALMRTRQLKSSIYNNSEEIKELSNFGIAYVFYLSVNQSLFYPL